MLRRTIRPAYTASPLNYTGGKLRLLPQLLPLLPHDVDTFVDLFCGGCNVGINVRATHHIYNDTNTRLASLLRFFQHSEPQGLLQTVKERIAHYELSDTEAHGYATYHCNSADGLAAYNRQPFMQLRADYNALPDSHPDKPLLLYMLIVFGFNNQLRFNADGEYNLPVGKRDFNIVMQCKLCRFIEALQAQEARIISCDFEQLDLTTLTPKSLVYLDPPYLITTATYNEGGGWTLRDEQRLLRFITRLDNAGIRFALSNVLTHKRRHNEALMAWLNDNPHIAALPLDMSYANASYHATERDSHSAEVLVTNCMQVAERTQYATHYARQQDLFAV